MAGTIEELEKELKVCAERGDHLEALDIFEEIERNQWLKPMHLLGMGQCLLKLRRRQDARRAWERAYEMNNEFEPAINMLNTNFPGWKKKLQAKKTKPKPIVVPEALRRPQPKASVSRPASPSGAGEPSHVVVVHSSTHINWDYVFEDAAAAKKTIEAKTQADDAQAAKPISIPEFTLQASPEDKS